MKNLRDPFQITHPPEKAARETQTGKKNSDRVKIWGPRNGG